VQLATGEKAKIIVATVVSTSGTGTRLLAEVVDQVRANSGAAPDRLLLRGLRGLRLRRMPQQLRLRIILMRSSSPIQLVIVDPGHFHAALIQREMFPGVSPRVSVYAPLTPELVDYLALVARFNARSENPTAWELDIRASPGSFERMLGERPGNALILTAGNRGKIDRILAALDAGYHVFADKPWIIRAADLPKLAAALDLAERRGLAACDIMTERFEITSILQRELVADKELFGDLRAVKAKSIHHIMKLVAGSPIRRAPWFFDLEGYGDALADVGTHVVDLVQWAGFPDRQLDPAADVRIVEAQRWPTPLDDRQFHLVTGVNNPDGQPKSVPNNFVWYTVCGVPVELEILWNWEAPSGTGDVYEAAFQGKRSKVEIRQGAEERFVPELYVAPASGVLRNRVAALAGRWPGLGLEERGGEARVTIPEAYRAGHEAHFAQVARQFFGYIQASKCLPAWEKSNMLVKYFISTADERS
jgi:predicted dehydrogenase